MKSLTFLQDLNEIAAKNPTVKTVKIGTIFFQNFSVLYKKELM